MACLKVSLFSSIILAFSVWSILFLIPTLLLLFDSSILRNCGCPFHASLQLAFRAHALQRSACLMLLFLQRLLHCPHPVFINSAVLPLRHRISVLLHNLSLPCFDTHLLSLKPLAIGHQLFLRNSESLFKLFLCLLGSSSLLSIALQFFNVASETFFSVSTLSFLSSHGLVRFLLFSVFNVLLVYSSLTWCWMCTSSVSFVCSSRSAFGFSQVFLFF